MVEAPRKSRNCFLHDADASSDRKMQIIIFKHGAEGYGIIWYLIEAMRRERNTHVQRTDSELCAHVLRTEANVIQDVILTAIDVGLFSEDENGLTAPALLRDLQVFEIKKEKARERMKNVRARNANATRTQEEDIDIEEEDKEEEIIKERVPRKTKTKAQDKIIFGQFKHVHLSPQEYKKLTDEFGQSFADRVIEKLDSWIEQDPTPTRKRRGKKPLASFRAWTINAVAKEQEDPSRTNQRLPNNRTPSNGIISSYGKILEGIKQDEA